MHTAQWEFGFGDMTKIGTPIRLRGSGPQMTTAERDKRIVELRRQNVPYKKIKAECRCSEATVIKVLKRDAPNLVYVIKQRPPGPRASAKAERATQDVLALPPTDDEPLAKIGVHFWDMPMHGQCKYIVARDPDDRLARFCGEGTVTFGCAWCAEHLAIVAQPKKKFMAEAA